MVSEEIGGLRLRLRRPDQPAAAADSEFNTEEITVYWDV